MPFVGVATNSTTVAGVSVTDPSAAGNYGVGLWMCDGGGQTCTPPAGWSTLFTNTLTTDGATYYVFENNGMAGGGGTLTFTGGTALDAGLVVAAWSGIDATTPHDVTIPAGITNDTAIASAAAVSAPTITPANNGCTILFIGFGDMTSSTPNSDLFTPPSAPSAFTSRAGFFDTSGWNSICLADMTQATATATGTITGATIRRTGSNFGVVGFTIALRPAAGGGGGGDSNIETPTRKMQRGLYPHLWMRPQEDQRVRAYSIGDGRRERAAFDSKLKPAARRSQVDAHL